MDSWGEVEQEGGGAQQDRENTDPPLLFASLAGRQELILKFTEMNQFGLPRAVDEVEIGLGRLSLHIFPHQVTCS